MPPVPEAEADVIRALPRKELQALAKELGVKVIPLHWSQSSLCTLCLCSLALSYSCFMLVP